MRVLDKNEVTEVSGGLFGLLALKRGLLNKLFHRPAPRPHNPHNPPRHPKHHC